MRLTHKQLLTELTLGGDVPMSVLRGMARARLDELQALNSDLLAALKRTDDKLRVFIADHPDPGADALAVLSCNEGFLKAAEKQSAGEQS